MQSNEWALLTTLLKKVSTYLSNKTLNVRIKFLNPAKAVDTVGYSNLLTKLESMGFEGGWVKVYGILPWYSSLRYGDKLNFPTVS